MESVTASVAKLLNQCCLTKDEGLLVALSGGVDSVALLTAVVEWSEQITHPPKIEAFHMHHGFRGEEADRDAKFSFQLCQKFKIPLHLVHENLSLKLGTGQPSLETLSRNQRRFHFEQIAYARNCSFVLLGHHADDQAETVLGNLLRGCGLKGLSAMHPVSQLGSAKVQLLRPFLDCRKQVLKDYLDHKELKGLEDSSNNSSQHRRNRLRHQVIPALLEESPEWITHMNRLASEMHERWKQIEAKLQPRFELIFSSGPFISIPPAVWEGLENHEIADFFREALLTSSSTGGQLSRGHLEGLLRLAAGHQSPEVDLPGSRWARRCGRWIHIQPRSESTSLEWSPTTLQGAGHNHFLGLNWKFPATDEVSLRPWQMSDRWPDRESRSVETLRVAGIPAEVREWWPVLIDPLNGEVIGSPGIAGPKVQLSCSNRQRLNSLSFHLLRVTQK